MPSPDSPATSWLVTGGSGLLGRHVVDAAARAGIPTTAPGSRDLDIRDRAQLATLVDHLRPTVVIHLAYRKDDPEVIVAGTTNVARAAAQAGARLVHLSTDALFGGRGAPYTEDDEPTPVTDYGRWKAAAEAAVTSIHRGAVVVRTSLLYRTDQPAPCQLDVLEALAGRSSMCFFTDEIRCFTPVTDLADAVVELARRPAVQGVLHVAAPSALDRASFAEAVARWAGLDPAGVPRSTIAESGLDRPGRVILDTTRARALGLRCRSVDEALAFRPRSS